MRGPSATTNSQRRIPLLSVTIAEYCEAKTVTENAWTEKTEAMHRGVCGELIDLLGDRPIN